jgi:hypothetical protein
MVILYNLFNLMFRDIMVVFEWFYTTVRVISDQLYYCHPWLECY